MTDHPPRPNTPRGPRLRELWATAIVALQYALGLGTIALVLFIFGVRPDNLASWLASPVGLLIVVATLAATAWLYRKQRR